MGRKNTYNKTLKRDSCSVDFLCSDFCDESGLRTVGLCGTYSLTRSYAAYKLMGI
ncbi:DUF3265 domain-containing protein [Vibrio fluvialis]|nr:DUF3265 domain-containing protein [Vibrio fluvialis]EKO4001787.1 DUF3265 domain-containing protein [Vibrio fluvialis]MCE7638094.1 DUF3265 domain-containing protein [Vibrio fluvialis]MCE7654184.1 DUF3265 domain-containing protein [Vibrio fluvialis]